MSDFRTSSCNAPGYFLLKVNLNRKITKNQLIFVIVQKNYGVNQITASKICTGIKKKLNSFQLKSFKLLCNKSLQPVLFLPLCYIY